MGSWDISREFYKDSAWLDLFKPSSAQERFYSDSGMAGRFPRLYGITGSAPRVPLLYQPCDIRPMSGWDSLGAVGKLADWKGTPSTWGNEMAEHIPFSSMPVLSSQYVNPGEFYLFEKKALMFKDKPTGDFVYFDESGAGPYTQKELAELSRKLAVQIDDKLFNKLFFAEESRMRDHVVIDGLTITRDQVRRAQEALAVPLFRIGDRVTHKFNSTVEGFVIAGPEMPHGTFEQGMVKMVGPYVRIRDWVWFITPQGSFRSEKPQNLVNMTENDNCAKQATIVNQAACEREPRNIR